MDLALKALAEPRRRAILRLVRDGELSSGEIASQFDITGPAISQHLGVLKEAGLVNERRAGTRRLYRARPEGMAEVRRFVEDFWDGGLGRLQDAAEQAQRDKDKETDDG
jgi:DNA-binding transcriptional ArsR family regulator